MVSLQLAALLADTGDHIVLALGAGSGDNIHRNDGGYKGMPVRSTYLCSCRATSQSASAMAGVVRLVNP